MFIALEGIDGCGKTTVARMLHDKLKNTSKGCLLTRKLGGDATALIIRDLVVNPNHNLDLEAAYFMIFASAIHTAKSIILPALADNKYVVCDRYLASAWVYQIAASDILSEPQKALMTQVLKAWLPVPDLTVVLDVSVEEALRRTGKRTSEFSKKDVYERCDYPEWERRRIAYLDYKNSPVAGSGRVVVIHTDDVPKDKIGDIADYIALMINEQ